MNKLREKLSIQLAKNPGRIVLIGILFFNIAWFIIGALIISALSLNGTEHMNFIEAAYHTITMILDAGCIEAVVADLGTSGVAIAIACLVIIVIGMITFTGAVIGYVTNFISDFIANANTGARKLYISDHTVILNWNTRASEIINDLLFTRKKEKVVVLVSSRKEEIKKEIEERLSGTTAKENADLRKRAKEMPFFKGLFYKINNKIRRTVTYIVREGDVFSLKQLQDIQVEKAKAVIILGNDKINSAGMKNLSDDPEERPSGNSQTVKTLMQVADITAAADSADKQNIIVEVTDAWTQDIIDKIIRSKEVEGKCNIVPICVNQILGQILSQFTLMPELNLVYRDMFSNKGTSFYNEKRKVDDEEEYIAQYLSNHCNAIPMGMLETDGEMYFYYTADSEDCINKTTEIARTDYRVKMNRDFWLDKKNVIVLGHNSDCDEIMKGFAAFRCEWNYPDDVDDEILRVTVIDDKEHLDKMNHYRQYPFVAETVVADIYDREKIYETINRVITYSDEDTSILILSDDNAKNEDIDANALANLIYVQDIINDKKKEAEKRGEVFDTGSIDVVVEIVDPKHHDIVNSYDINNVVISNRYISKMITQIGEKASIYEFYNDILTYDVDVDIDGEEEAEFENKEVYAKKVSTLFTELPAPCKADELVRAVYHASLDESRDCVNLSPTIVIGYVRRNGEMMIFGGDLSHVDVKLREDDRLIVYCAH